jgi:membrane-bound serine protease (ClpP class)
MVSDPNIAILLMALGALGVYAEFCLPGKVIPGVVGSIVLTVGLASLFKTTTPIYWPLALVIIVPFAVATVFLLRIAIRARRNKRTV